jgi:peptidoglycan/LPS O-acetylase OafA/YrhL
MVATNLGRSFKRAVRRMPRITGAAAGAPETGRTGRIAGLDAIRGLAILLVVFHHYITAPSGLDPESPGGRLIAMLSFGWTGVDLFFVLSGYLIGGIILRNGHQDGFLLAFYRRRAARLLPLYLVVLALYVIFGPLILSGASRAAQWLVVGNGEPIPLWSYLLYLQNFFIAAKLGWGGHWLAPTWSLAIEEQFYLIAPLLLLTVPRRHLVSVLIALIAISPVCRVLLMVGSGDALPGYVLLPARWDALFIGILGAYVVNRPDARGWLEANPRAIMQAFVGLGAVIAGMQACGFLAYNQLAYAIFGCTLIALFALSFIAVVLFVDNGFTRGLAQNRWLVQLGVISYGVYLIHQPMQGIVRLAYDQRAPRFLDITDAGVALAAAALTIIAATLSWRYLEQPILARSVPAGTLPRDEATTVPAEVCR